MELITFEENEKLVEKLYEDIEDCKVYYSVYKPFDEIPLSGSVKFIAYRNKLDDNSKDYVSKIMSNPTWEQIAHCADDMIKTTGCYDCCFLEDVYVASWEPANGTLLAKFTMGL